MSVSGIQGHPLEITVFGCARLKNTEWISRQDPYVCVEYGGNKFRTRTCTDGGKNPTFQEKFVFTLIEGLREMTVAVWNSNTLTYDDFIGSGKIHLHKVLSQGFDDTSWSLQSTSGRYAGEVRLIMHYANANREQQQVMPIQHHHIIHSHRQLTQARFLIHHQRIPHHHRQLILLHRIQLLQPTILHNHIHLHLKLQPTILQALFLESILHNTKVMLQNVKCEEATSRMNCIVKNTRF
ncbi:CONSERVED SERINE PROLINE-RICH PROTEIN [Salix koriyanagi]|uniref:CONSERVED SERINE PROLINE-RICH PROTEIN n=1 Tax=Salix koriyanagi TaxID=2511006 RepID=A0A9Q1AMY7_9ROSI|nr:CONSERVED SERINE PROLINE-RICH PROTEIN [Salix koriyanagi]